MQLEMTTAKRTPRVVKQKGIDAIVVTDVCQACADLLARTIPSTNGRQVMITNLGV